MTVHTCFRCLSAAEPMHRAWDSWLCNDEAACERRQHEQQLRREALKLENATVNQLLYGE